MTMTSPKKTSAPTLTPQKTLRRSSDAEWTAVQSGLWVCKKDGEFAGMIEARWGEGFIATTRLAKTLGVFETVEEAKASFRD